MKKLVLAITTLGLLTLLTTGVISADVKNCRPIYGGGDTCIQAKNFTVDTRIQDPKSKNFVDNLNNDNTFPAGSILNMAITVKNTTKNEQSGIEITNTFPQFVDFAEGNGKYDQTKRSLTFTIDKLNANESKTYLVKARVTNQENLPQNGVSCVANLVQAKIKQEISSDNVQFCLTGTTAAKPQARTSTPAPTATNGGQQIYPKPSSSSSPATGPEAFALFALLPSGVAGYLIRKKVLRG